MTLLQKVSFCKFIRNNPRLFFAYRRKKIVIAVASLIIRLFFICLVSLPFLSSKLFSDSREEIPLDIRNNYAPTFLFLEPSAVSPTTLAKGKSSFTSGYSIANDIKESNLYVDKTIPFAYQRPFLYNYFSNRYSNPVQAYIASDYFRFGRLENQYRTSIDLESSYFQFRYNYGITDKIELGVQASVLSYNSGIFDAAINSFHSIIGVSTGKEFVPSNKYKYYVSGENGIILSTPPRTGLGDSVLSAKWNFKASAENGFSFALVGLAKVPTGAFRYEMGSGKPDGGAGFAMKYKYDKFIGYFNAYGIAVSNSILGKGANLKSYAAATFTLEYLMFQKISFLTQLDVRSAGFSYISPYLSRPPILISFGANWKVRKTSILQVCFTEDLSITVPDITLQILWKEYL